MNIISEKYNKIDIDELIEIRKDSYHKIFAKVDIYNHNTHYNLTEGTHYNTNIVYTSQELDDIKDMFKMMREHLLYSIVEESLLNSLNEGVLDTAKSAWNKTKEVVTNAKDKMSDWTSEQWQKFANKVNPKMAEGLKLLDKIIESGIKTAKELGLKIAQLLATLADNIRNAAIKLGAFGQGAVTAEQSEEVFNEKSVSESYHYSLNSLMESSAEPSADQVFNDMNANTPEDEKNFLSMIVMYVKQHCSQKESQEFDGDELNEANKFISWIKGNEVAGCLFTGKWHGKNIPWYKRLLVTAIGSGLIYLLGLCAPLFGVVGIGATIFNISIVTIQILWVTRGVVSVLLKRATTLRPGEKYWDDPKFLISLALTSGLAVFSAWKAIQHYIAVQNDIQINDEHIQELREFAKGKHTEEEINKFIAERPWLKKVSEDPQVVGTAVDAVDPNQMAAEWSKEMNGCGSGKEWLERMADKAQSNPELLQNTPHNLASNMQYPGGSEKYAIDNISKLSEMSGLSKEVIKDMIKHQRVNFTSQINGETTWGSILPCDENGMKLYTAMADLAKEQGKPFNFTDLGTGGVSHDVVRNFVKIAAVAAPIAKIAGPFFAVFDFMTTDDGYIVTQLGSEESKNYSYIADSVKQMTLSELAEKHPTSKESVEEEKKEDEKAAKDNNTVLNSVSNKDKEAIQKAAKDNENIKDKMQIAINNCKAIGNPDEQKVAVWYGYRISDSDLHKLYDSDSATVEEWKKGRKDEELIPLFFLNPLTMTGYDLADADSKGPRKNPWYFKGMQNHLTVKPLFNSNKNTKEYIAKMFGGMVENGVKLINATSIFSNAKVIEKDGKEWKVREGVEDAPMKQFGHLTPSEFCQVLNNEIKPYTLTGGEHAVDIHLDKQGNISSASSRKENVDGPDSPDYVKNAILPIITNTNTDIYKEIMQYADSHDNFKKLFVVEKEANEAVEHKETMATKTDDHQLNVENIMKYEVWLRRSMSSFYQNIDQSTIGKFFRKIGSKLNIKEYSEDELADNWKDIAALSHIIWKYKGLSSIWKKQCTEAGVDFNIKEAKKAEAAAQEQAKKDKEAQEKIKKASKEDKTKEAAKQLENALEQDVNKGAEEKAEEPKEDSPKEDDKETSAKDAKKKYNTAKEWCLQEIISRMDKDSEMYNAIAADEDLKKYFIYKSGKLREDRILNDKYLILTLFHKYENNEKMELSDSEWNSLKRAIVKASKKSKKASEKIAVKRIKRFKKLFNIISKYMAENGIDADKWGSTVKEGITDFNRKEWHMADYFKNAYGYDWTK